MWKGSVSQSGAKAVLLQREEGDPEIYTPEKVLPNINSRKELEAMLNWYAKPSLFMMGLDNVTARRHFIERTRPALRWYCKHLSEPAPRWLNDDNLPEWSEEERTKLFGDKPLHVVEFERRGPPAAQDMKPQGKPQGKTSAAGQR